MNQIFKGIFDLWEKARSMVRGGDRIGERQWHRLSGYVTTKIAVSRDSACQENINELHGALVRVCGVWW